MVGQAWDAARWTVDAGRVGDRSVLGQGATARGDRLSRSGEGSGPGLGGPGQGTNSPFPAGLCPRGGWWTQMLPHAEPRPRSPWGRRGHWGPDCAPGHLPGPPSASVEAPGPAGDRAERGPRATSGGQTGASQAGLAPGCQGPTCGFQGASLPRSPETWTGTRVRGPSQFPSPRPAPWDCHCVPAVPRSGSHCHLY